MPVTSSAMNELPAPAKPVDAATELVRLKRKLTPKQRRLLRALPLNNGQFWAALEKLGYSSMTGHRWMRNPNFARARELIEQQQLDAIGITTGYVLGRTKDVVERCMQAEPVIVDGKETGIYEFRENGALRGLELLGRYRKLWTEEGAAAKIPSGPGLTVLLQQSDGTQIGVQMTGLTDGRVLVNLPKPRPV